MRHYLVAVDSTLDANRVFEFVKNFVKKEDYVYLLTVSSEIIPEEVGPFGDVLVSYEDMKDYFEINKKLANASSRVLNYFGQQLTSMSIPHTCILAKGSPKNVICDEAKKLHADLVIMGRGNKGRIERAFLGSTSEYCSHNLSCAILVVP